MTSGSPRSAEGSRVPDEVLDAIESQLARREERRAELYQRARKLRRLAQGTMGRIHEGRDVASAIAQVRTEAAALSEWLRSEGRGDEGLAHDALQEAAEALLLEAVVRREPIPGPEAIGVDAEPYLLGLGDVVGEVRRLALDRLAAGEVAEAERHLATMEHLYRALLRFDLPRAIIALKPKQDVARSLVERTRGDVTMARMLGGRARAPEGGP